MSEPWASGMGWEPANTLPGHAAELRRLERLEQAERARLAGLRQERADARYEAWAMRRMEEMAFRGQPFDPGDWRTLARSEAEFLNETFVALERQDAREYRRQLIDAGLLHVLDARPGELIGAGASSAQSPPFSAGSAARLGRIKNALRRWSSRTSVGFKRQAVT